MASVDTTPDPASGGGVQHWTVRTRTVVPWAQIEGALASHLAYEELLAARGILLLAGPFLNTDEGFTGEGFAVYAASAESDALDLAQADPFVREGLRVVTAVEHWSIRRVGAGISGLRSEDERVAP